MTGIIRWCTIGLAIAVMVSGAAGCGWRGPNSIPLPGTQGGGPGAFTVQAQLPDVSNIQQNSAVRVGDVAVGTVTKIERQNWHALLTMRLNGDVSLPANATATIGQTSLLGSLHVELAPPKSTPPQGRLHDGSLLPLSAGGSYPTTEQTLAALSMVLNGGGLGQLQDVTEAFSTAFAGREDDLRSLINQVNTFVGHLNDQTGDIVTATESLNSLAGQFASRKPVIDDSLRSIPDALAVLNDNREELTAALALLGKLGALASDSVNQTKDAFVQELHDLGPVLESLANSGPALTKSLGFLSTFPWPKDTITKWFRGDYANMTAVIDLTLSRLDRSILTGTRWEGDLTELEMQWGRTIGQLPSPYTHQNPLVMPYRFDQGP